MKAKDIIAEAIRQMSLAVTHDGYVDEKHRGKIRRYVRGEEGVTYISIIFEDGYIYHVGNQYCHAGLNIQSEEFDDIPKYVVHRIQWEQQIYREFPIEMKEAFFQWLTIDSPYSTIFVRKGGKEVVESGYLVARCDVPANLLAGGLFAARMITEHFGNIAWSWWKLVERGVHPNLAFLYAHKISVQDHENVYIKNWDWHVPLNGNFGDKYITAFVSGSMYNPTEDYTECRTYYCVHDLWGEIHESGSIELSEDVANIRKEAMSTLNIKAVANPFMKNVIKEVCPVDEFMDKYAEYIINRHAVKEEERKVA